MPFLRNYRETFKLLEGVSPDKCDADCLARWVDHIMPLVVFPITAKHNPLNLTETERSTLLKKLDEIYLRNQGRVATPLTRAKTNKRRIKKFKKPKKLQTRKN